MVSVERIDIDDPEVDMDFGGRLLYKGTLFSGEVTEHAGQTLVSLDNYVNGVQDGRSQEWYRDGTLRSEGTARMGRPVGVSREWHPNGQIAADRVFAEDGLTMLCDRAWDESGNLTKNWKKNSA
ncbi:toxin-antitoxin system YwqK family antitoxin [Streptomyces chattanoogensis]